MAKRTAQTTNTTSRSTYGIFTAVIVALVLVIGYFTFLLVKPDKVAEPTSKTNTNTVVSNSNNNNGNSNVNTNNTNTNVNENENANENANTNEDKETTNTNNDEDTGLVQPDPDAPGEEITLYFPKSSTSCGEVSKVVRKQELGDDKYGDIILAAMAGPTDKEAGYVDGVPSTVRLRLVEYTADGPVVTVGEGYNDLSDCQKKTVDAQLIKTANAMFDLPESTAGTVVVGTVAPVEEDATTDTVE